VQRIAMITDTESRVAAELLADGAANREIADRLGVSEDTVKSHIKRLLAAADCHTRTEFVVRVLRGQVRLRVRTWGADGERPVRAEAGAAGAGVA
jgi:DNA-binding NarL/FixJ family response regulator